MFLIEKGTRGGVAAFGIVRALVEALLHSLLDLFTEPWLASLSCSTRRSIRG